MLKVKKTKEKKEDCKEMTKLELKIKRPEKNNKGITLIALVITIIMLLLLAGVSIATLTGQNGILTKASTSKKETQKSSAKEKVEIAVMGSFGTDGKIEMDTLNKNLSQVEGIDKEFSDLTGTTLPKDVIVDHYKITIDDKGKVTVKGENNLTLPSTDNTKPFLPEGSEIINDNLETGVIIKDKNHNEWVWIEVPKSIYTPTTTKTDYAVIETALQTYTSDYRQSGYTDTFYSSAQHGFANATEYNNWKNSMLTSVFENGGFYIGRYETGTDTARFSSSEALTPPFIQRDKYPYNSVTCSQAQTLAKQLAVGGKTSSLMFGIQWNLVMKFMEEKGAKTQAELKSDSSSWGNYSNSTFEITRGFYTTVPTSSGSWNEVNPMNQYTKPSSSVLLSTGATERNSVLGIYDFTGNVWEWTLEKSSSSTSPCVSRGGNYSYNGFNDPTFAHNNGKTSHSNNHNGLRATLW